MNILGKILGDDVKNPTAKLTPNIAYLLSNGYDIKPEEATPEQIQGAFNEIQEDTDRDSRPNIKALAEFTKSKANLVDKFIKIANLSVTNDNIKTAEMVVLYTDDWDNQTEFIKEALDVYKNGSYL